LKPNAIFIHSGEFGYELLSFQGILRRVRHKYNILGVCTFPGRDALYSDFADFIIPYPTEILERIDPSTNKEQGFPAFADVKDYLRTVIPNYDSYNFQIFSPHLKNFSYPLDERLDLTGSDGSYMKIKTSAYVKDIVNRIVLDKNFFVCVPRYAVTHPQRTWPLVNWHSLIQQLIYSIPDIYFVFFVFSESVKIKQQCYSTQEEGFNSNRVIMVNFPTVEIQIEFLNRAIGSIYNHSGAAFLPLFCSTPLFTFATTNDFEHIYNRPNSIYNLLLSDKWYAVDGGNNLQNLLVDDLVSSFFISQMVFHQRSNC